MRKTLSIVYLNGVRSGWVGRRLVYGAGIVGHVVDRRRRIDGTLIVRETRKGPTYYAKWRDSTRTQVMRQLGPAWIERRGADWRKRRGSCPDGHLVPNAAAERMRELIDAHERDLAAGMRDRSD